MAKPRKEDQDEFERMSDVMKRLVKTPPKPHKAPEQPRDRSATAKKNPPKQNKKGTG